MAVNRGGAAHELAGGLSLLRERSGLTTRKLGQMIGASAANISNWLTGARQPTEERLVQLLDAMEATSDERERLLSLRRIAEGPGELVAGLPGIGEQLTRLIQYEQLARVIKVMSPLLPPGLLQTRRVARATLSNHPDIDTRLTLRMGRQKILELTRDPTELTAIIGADVLTSSIVSPDDMAEQLRHLLKMGELPNVTIQLMPGTAPGYHAMRAGPFVLMEFASSTPVVHLEHLSASTFLWDKEDVDRYVEAFDEVQKMAMTPARSAEVIADLLNGMEKA